MKKNLQLTDHCGGIIFRGEGDHITVAEAFQRLHQEVDRKVDACRERMRYDMFVTEHALCKYSKSHSYE